MDVLMEETGLYRLSHPSRIYLETTTRCNLACEMCVKHSTGGGIIEGDFDPVMLSSIDSVLPHVTSLILSGIGEPLLYPHLEELIDYASRKMSPDARIGFQTNGMLLTRERAESLIKAGLNLVCVSMDASTSDTFRDMRAGGELSEAENAISILKDVSSSLKCNVRIGIEFVITKSNIHHLVPTLKIAAERGADFAIVSHLIAYDEKLTGKVAYDRNIDKAVEFFERKIDEAKREGIDIKRYFDIRWKFIHTPDEERVIKAVEKMTAQAQAEGIHLNLQSLMDRDRKFIHEVEEVFRGAEVFAFENGIELNLPASTPRGVKRCDFIESGSLFISWNGDVHPCHFLWHKFQCYISGWKKFITPVSFGNLKDSTVSDIWNSDEYKNFRVSVAKYDYPVCSNCSLAPCDYIYSESFEQDCYTNTIPCCDCQWCLGLFQCLK